LNHPQEAAQLAAVGFMAGNTPVSLYALGSSLLPKSIQDPYFDERNFALRNLVFQPYGEYEDEGYARSGIEIPVPILIWLRLPISLLLILVSQ
jgi:hypothetical protein